MSDKVYVGQNMSGFDFSPAFLPYSRVLLWLDDATVYEAGDLSGQTLEVSLPWASQEIADQMLDKIKGYVYKPFSATEALIDPAAELGDGITAGGLYSVLASADIDHDGLSAADILAPKGEDLNSEYPYITPLQKEIKRARSLISKTDKEIRLYVADEVNALHSEITETTEEIRLSVSEVSDDLSTLEGSVSELSVKLDSITLSVSNGVYSSTIKLMAGETEISSEQISFSGMVSFYDLKTSGSTVINGDNITTGTIEGRTFRSILDAAGGVGGEIEMCYLDNTSVAGGIRLDDQGAGTDSDRKYRMFLYTEESNGIAFALKLKSASGMSLEAEENIYIDAGTKVTIYGANITAATNGRFILNGGTVEIGGAVSFSGSVDFSGATVTGLPEADTTTEEETT